MVLNGHEQRGHGATVRENAGKQEPVPLVVAGLLDVVRRVDLDLRSPEAGLSEAVPRGKHRSGAWQRRLRCGRRHRT